MNTHTHKQLTKDCIQKS